MITAVLLAALSQQLPEGLPHPSHPMRTDVVREMSSGFEIGWDDQFPLWVVLSPDRMTTDGDPVADRREFALSEGQRMGLSNAEAAAWYDAEATAQVDLRFRISSKGGEILAGSERVAVGRMVDVSDWTAQSVVLDLDVEIASAAAIADPVIGYRFNGSSLAVRLQPVPGVGWIAECALVDTTALNGGRIETANVDIGEISRLTSKLTETEFSVLLIPGQTSKAQFPGPDGAPVEIELEALGAVPSVAMAFGQGSWIDAGVLIADPRAWDRFFDRVVDGTSSFGDSSGAMVVTGAGHEERAALFAEEMVAAAAPVNLQIRWILEQDGSVLASDSARVGTPLGRPVRFASGELTRVLEDWDVEVALGSRIPDPVFRDIFSGTRCVATARQHGAGYEVDLDLVFNALSLQDPHAIHLAAAAPARSPSEGEMPAAPAQRVQVDGISIATTAFRGSYRLDADGKLTLERSAEKLLGLGARIRVEIQVVGN